jgi:hypothetical protein
MDGLSAAASGFAVVSLAVQLVGSVRQIRQFLRSISEAPEELRRLMDLLEELELILEQVGILVQSQRRNSTLWETGVLTSVLKAANSCQIKLAMPRLIGQREHWGPSNWLARRRIFER